MAIGIHDYGNCDCCPSEQETREWHRRKLLFKEFADALVFCRDSYGKDVLESDVVFDGLLRWLGSFGNGDYFPKVSFRTFILKEFCDGVRQAKGTQY